MKNIPREKALLFCNGALPPKRIVRKYLSGEPLLVCADGGANAAAKIGIAPHVVIGDMDSILPPVLEACRKNGARIIRLRRQTDTDFEKALLYLARKGVRETVVFGATGRLTDHTLGNFSILLRHADNMRIRFVDRDSLIETVRADIRFPAARGDRISLLPFPSASGITTRGLRYPLRNESLSLGTREGTCNEAVASEVRISVRRGTILLFRKG